MGLTLWPFLSVVELLTVVGATVDFWARKSCAPGLHDPTGVHPKYAVQAAVEHALSVVLPPVAGRWSAEAYGFVLFLAWLHVLVRRLPSFAGLDWTRALTKLAFALHAAVLAFFVLWGTSPEAVKRSMLMSAVVRFDREQQGSEHTPSREELMDLLDTYDRHLGSKCVPRVVQALLYPAAASLALLAMAVYFSWAGTKEARARAAAAAASPAAARAAIAAAAAAAAAAGKDKAA